MNCEKFRRKLLEDPNCRDPEFLAHREKCGPCNDEAGEVERLDSGLRDLFDSKPPADLQHDLRRIPRRRFWVPTALAATLAGLTAFGAWWMTAGTLNAEAAIVAEVVEHIEHEPQAFTNTFLARDGWATLSPRVLVDTTEWNYSVTYAAPCIVMEKKGLHLVLAGDEGPVTVLVIVDTEVGDSMLFHEADHRGVLRPLENGLLAVVSASGHSVDDLAAELAPRIRILA